MKLFLKYSLFSFLVFSFLGCKKNKTQTSTKGAVYFQFKQYFGSQNFALNTTFSDNSGNKLSFTRASFYLSKPVIKNTSGVSLVLKNEYFLVHHDTKTALITSVDETTIKSVSTNVGIDSATNHEDPANYGSSSPLAYQTPSMHWGWSSFYLFIVVEGNIDTDGDGNFDDTFAFHIGTDNYLKQISNSNLNIQVIADKSAIIPIKIDYSKLFEGIDLTTDNKTHTTDNPTLANTFVQNISKAFIIE